MNREHYFEVADNLLSEGTIDLETYWCMIDNADDFCIDE